MSQEPDLSKTVKKLFERPSRKGAPDAFFRPPAETHPKLAVAAAPQKRWIFSVRKKVNEMVQRDSARRTAGSRIIGMDLGASAVKVARLEFKDRVWRLTGVAVEELPQGISEGPDWERAVQETVGKLKRSGLLNGPLVVGFHHLDSLVEPIRMPRMPISELSQSVLWEAKERLSLNPDRSVIRYIVAGDVTVDGQPHHEILVVASPKEQILRQWHLLVDLGLKVAAVEPVALANFYILSRLNLWKGLDMVGLLELGLRTAHLSFARGDAVHFTRSFQVAGDSFTRAIADYCQIDYGQGEELKRQFGISQMALEEDRQEKGHEAEDRVRISHALGLHMEKLVAEIEQSYRYFAFELGRSESQRMDRLILTGGGALLKNLSEFLSNRLSVPVHLADPFKGIQVDPTVGPLLQAGWNLRLTVALGLALRSTV